VEFIRVFLTHSSSTYPDLSGGPTQSPCHLVDQDVKIFTPQRYRGLKLGPAAAALLISMTLGLTSACLPRNDLALTSSATSPREEERLSAPVGTSASLLLNGQRFDELEVEIQPLGRAQLTQEAINHIRAFLNDHLALAASKIDITLNPAIQSQEEEALHGSSSCDLTQVRAWERRYRRTRPILNRASIFILVANAPFTDDTPRRKTFALAHQNTSIVIYHPTLLRVLEQPAAPERWQLEAAVVEHELGHLLGLVNLKGGDHLNESTHSPSHCAETSCLMSENTELAARLALAATDDGVPRLCDHCKKQLEDLRNTNN
jgi:hypothetical protein